MDKENKQMLQLVRLALEKILARDNLLALALIKSVGSFAMPRSIKTIRRHITQSQLNL